MAGTSSNPPRPRKRVEAETAATTFKRARDGSAFTRCEECNKDVPVVLIDMHSCSLDSRIRMHLESQVVETETKKPAKKKKTVSTEKKVKNAKSKDPNAPKRPLTGFFIFLEEFRKEFKEANPLSKGVATVAKEGGAKWKSLSKTEKQVYLDRAAERKAEFAKLAVKDDPEDEENEDDEVVEIEPEEQEEEENDDKEKPEDVVEKEKLVDELDTGKLEDEDVVLEDEDVVLEDKVEDEKKTRGRRRLRKGNVVVDDD